MKREDFRYESERGANGNVICRIFYKNVPISAFGTMRDVYDRRRKNRMDVKSMSENAEATIRCIMSGASEDANRLIACIDAKEADEKR